MTTAVTSVTGNALSQLDQLGQLLKVDLLQVVGSPVLTLLQSLATIAQQPLSAASLVQAQAAWVIFTGNVLLALPHLGQDGAQAVLQFLIAKVQSEIPPAPAPPAA